MHKREIFRQKSYKKSALCLLVLLPLHGVFHAVMWNFYTKKLFLAEVGDLKRMGYLVGYEDCKKRLNDEQGLSGMVLSVSEVKPDQKASTVFVGDSFCWSLAMGCSKAKEGAEMFICPTVWDKYDVIDQIENWIQHDWFKKHRVQTIVIERAEYEFLNTFSPKKPWNGKAVSMDEILTGSSFSVYQKATPWSLTNNGNYKVVWNNFLYIFSPTALTKQMSGMSI
jgi:hypothetical protein